jgi:ribosomal protein L16 Arg81 hydroxylase
MSEPEVRQFDDEWRRWIAENLILECSRESILATLQREGFDEAITRAEIDRAADSPYLRGSQRLLNRLKKRDWLLEVHHRLNQLLPQAGTVDVQSRLSREQFLKDYYAANRPVLIKGALDDWPAMKKWSPGYLKERFGDRTVEVQSKRLANARYELQKDRHREQMKMAQFVDLVCQGPTNDVYMTASNTDINARSLAELWDDIIQIPEYLDGTLPQRGFFWFGPQGTLTPLHHDMTNNFMAQAYGRKLVTLIPSCDISYVYNEQHCYSPVDCGAPDLARFPLFRRASVIHCEIGPGDLLFLPIGWWHCVKGLSISMTVTFTNFVFDNDFCSIYSTYGPL